jgi:hypothetical protein
MQGSWIAGRAHYRCRYPNQYGLANRVQPPVYVREDAILPHLDAWLARVFDHDNLDATVVALTPADGDDTTRAQIERAERTLADCKQRLAAGRDELDSLVRDASDLVSISRSGSDGPAGPLRSARPTAHLPTGPAKGGCRVQPDGARLRKVRVGGAIAPNAKDGAPRRVAVA